MNGVYFLLVQVDEFYRKYDHVPEKFIRRKERLQASLLLWLRALDVSIPSLTAQRSLRVAIGIPLLRVYYSMASIMVSVCIQPNNAMAYDLHTQDFASIISQAVGLWKLVLPWHHDEAPSTYLPPPSFTVDMGFIPPLYYTALKCRVPSIRREAIGLLLFAPHRGGIWDGIMGACIVRRIIEMEEGDSYKDICLENHPDIFNGPRTFATDDTPLVPESARVRNVSVVLPDGTRSKAELIYRRCGTTADGSLEPETTETDLMFTRISSGNVNRCF
jgi:hypothetical protein